VEIRHLSIKIITRGKGETAIEAKYIVTGDDKRFILFRTSPQIWLQYSQNVRAENVCEHPKYRHMRRKLCAELTPRRKSLRAETNQRGVFQIPCSSPRPSP
jgi:hypothetical protein